MFKISFMGLVGSISYDTEALTWRAVHELLEEAFGENYSSIELSEYNVVAA